MTDNETLEGGQEQASSGLPIPKLESASAGSATSSVDTEAIAKKVAEILKPDFERVAQSTKDKRIAALEKRLGVGNLAELEELGVTIPDNVKLEYRLREMEQNRQSTQPQQTPSGGTGEALTAQEVSDVMAKFKLDANDPQVLEKLRGTYRNRDHFQATMAELVVARVTPQQPPSPAGLTQSATAGTTAIKGTALVADYKKDMLAARGKGNGFGNAIKEKYRAQGVDVDNINFTI